MPRTVSSEQLELFELLLDVGKLVEREAGAAVKREAGLQFSQYEILIRLRNAGGKLRMQDLARSLVSSPSRLTYQVAALERSGLVTRVSADDDDRGVLAVITPEGRSILADLAPVQSEVILATVIDPLTAGDVQKLIRALSRLRTHIPRVSRPPSRTRPPSQAVAGGE